MDNSGAIGEPLYAPHRKVFPKRGRGDFRRLKWIVMAVTLGIYYITPWLRWDRGDFAPDQAILIDMAHRRFYFFFIEIWPQEFYFIAGMLVMAGIGLFLVTSVVGRAWCGYTCPQTVWTDLFLVVERFFEGDRNARIKLDNGPWTVDKIRKRVMKHATWVVIAVATGGAWIFYFADAPTLLRNLFTGDAPVIAYATVAVLTATTYTFGGHMREQVCIYMCPWPRIQAAMLDEDSLVVTYNDWRGEPRTHGVKRAAAAAAEADTQQAGDCIDCNACVAVCPTGIDIRDGQQLACITCALCIDACDDIMGKLGRESGLISYSTLRDYEHNVAVATDPDTKAHDINRVRTPDGKLSPGLRHFNWRVLARPRTLIYTGVWTAIGLALLVGLVSRDRLQINVQHDRNPVFVTLSSGDIRNGYTVKLLNMQQEPRVISLSLDGLPGATMNVVGIDQPATDQSAGVSVDIPVDPDQLRSVRVFITQPRDSTQPGASEFRLLAEDRQSFEADTYSAVFEAPR